MNNQKEEGVNSFNGNWNDKKCFDWEMSNGITLENPHFVNLYKDTAQFINENIKFDKFTDLGGGVGAYCKAMKELGKEVHYYDGNIHHHEYAYNYKVADTYHFGDFTNMVIEGELIAMIEVAEHIEDERLLPFLKKVQCKYFHFSSTPHTSEMDADWGHINIKTEQQWVDVFDKCGYTLLGKINYPTNWSLLFKK